MASVCMDKCVKDTRDPRVPVRATYVNLYKWPESDAEFIKSVRRRVGQQQQQQQPRVVDSISCRQMYLRSYTFSRKESVPEKTRKCLVKVKDRVGRRRKGSSTSDSSTGSGRRKGSSRNKKCLVLRKVKEISCRALYRIFHRLLSCAASVDVVDHKDI